jgi:lysophospholipase L1-like esterase
VVGDIPDASAATNTEIIDADMVADTAVRAAANARLKAWAARRPQVAIIPLALFMQRVAANRAVTVHGRKFAAGITRRFLQDDELHPTPKGAALLALAIMDALVRQDRQFPTQDVRWSQSEVYRLGYRSAQQNR